MQKTILLLSRYCQLTTVGLFHEWDQLNTLEMSIRHNFEHQIQACNQNGIYGDAVMDEECNSLNTLTDAKEVLSSYGSNECNPCEVGLNQELVSLDAVKNPNWMEEAKELIRQKDMLQS